jgi:hypothetical protein
MASQVDQERLKRIDLMTTMSHASGMTSKGNADMHAGYAELADFLRALKGGVAVHRIDSSGRSVTTHIGLTPALDGISLSHG